MSENTVVATHTACIEFINPTGLYNPEQHAYSHITHCKGQARLSFISGQGGETVDGSYPASFTAQLEQALDNLECALQAISADIGQIAKLTVLIVAHDEQKLSNWSAALKNRLAGRPAPACTLIPVARLALEPMLIEIDAMVWHAAD